MKKLVRDDVTVPAAAAAAGGGDDDDEVKLSDERSSGSADGDADLLPQPADNHDDDLDDYHGVLDNHHRPTAGSSPSQASQPQQHQQLGHRLSSWHDVPSSFQRFPALSQLHYSYPLTGSSSSSRSGDDVRALAGVDSVSSWRSSDASYCSSVSRLHSSYRRHSSSTGSVVEMQRAAPGCESLLHSAAGVHQWYSRQTPPHQTLLT